MPTGKPWAAKLIDTFGDAYEIFRAEPDDLARTGLAEKVLTYLSYKELDNAFGVLKICERQGIDIIPYGSPEYPSRLAGIDTPPAVLYVKGRIPQTRKFAAVVGTRRMSVAGMSAALRLSSGLAAGGCTVVSGLALGIDGVAAAAAIRAGGQTVAVLGCGADIVFPEEHSALARAVTENGAIVTEYPPGTLPLSPHFPERNRIISGMSDAVTVVEGGYHSGSVITGHAALAQNRKLFCVPGDFGKASCSGSNLLFREGAAVALDAGDVLGYFEETDPGSVDIPGYSESASRPAPDPGILAEYGVAAANDTVPETAPPPKKRSSPVRKETPEPEAEEKKLPPEGRLRDFWSAIPDGQKVGAESFSKSGYGVNESMNLLSMLEISGFVKSVPGGMFEKI